jgi:selenoprotein W-related protein
MCLCGSKKHRFKGRFFLFQRHCPASRKFHFIEIIIINFKDTMNPDKPIVTISYCPKCKWMLRAAYMAQELLSTFENDIGGVLLQPADVNGEYIISVNEIVIFDRKFAGGFPEVKSLKQLVRDIVSPGKSLGHSDR